MPNQSRRAEPTEAILPAEWTRQSGVLLTWPHGAGDWGPFLEGVEAVFLAIAAEVTRREGLLVACSDGAHREHVMRRLAQSGADLGRVGSQIAPSNDSWARDHGPLTVLRNGAPEILDFVFNGWGGKFPAALDNAITKSLHACGAFGTTPLHSVDLVLEGGSIDADGAGTLLTTERCLLAPTRNPQLTRQDIEQRLQALLGARRVLWLGHGALLGDDTDSHIDVLARFCDPATLAHTSCLDASDPNYPELQAMERELAQLRTSDGKPYRLVPLPIPAPQYDERGGRLPASYANFLIVNGAVLVPVYRDGADGVALERLAGCFPDRDIVPIDCRALIRQHGSLHCVTMQLPEGVLAQA
jgi:agmatine/peptidylarginine deiminase